MDGSQNSANQQLARIQKELNKDSFDADIWIDKLFGMMEDAGESRATAQKAAVLLEAFFLSEDDDLHDALLDALEELSEPSDLLVSACLGNREFDSGFQSEFAAVLRPNSVTQPDSIDLLMDFTNLPFEYDSDEFNRTKCGVATAALSAAATDAHLRLAMDKGGPGTVHRIAINPSTSQTLLLEILEWCKARVDSSEDQVFIVTVLSTVHPNSTQAVQAKALELSQKLGFAEQLQALLGSSDLPADRANRLIKELKKGDSWLEFA